MFFTFFLHKTSTHFTIPRYKENYAIKTPGNVQYKQGVYTHNKHSLWSIGQNSITVTMVIYKYHNRVKQYHNCLLLPQQQIIVKHGNG